MRAYCHQDFLGKLIDLASRFMRANSSLPPAFVNSSMTWSRVALVTCVISLLIRAGGCAAGLLGAAEAADSPELEGLNPVGRGPDDVEEDAGGANDVSGREEEAATAVNK